MGLSGQQRADFLEVLGNFYTRAGRGTLPWRQPESDGGLDPYKVLVSELMLQQTQVARVIPKYLTFLESFPSVGALARAELGDVLAWQGLGYNRRAKFLWLAAGAIEARGSFPDTAQELIRLPGVGANTAGAILAYAFNRPVVFIETNVRTAYIHHFFAGQTEVTDKQIAALVKQTLDHEQPREFYWALMDYGSHLKSTVGNLNRASKLYGKQSAFHGSRRQIRGQIIRELGSGTKTAVELRTSISDDRFASVLAELVEEGLIRQSDSAYSL